jgi:hypothetical protein
MCRTERTSLTASAANVRPQEDAWLVSYSVHILAVPLNSAESLRKLFGWDGVPPVSQLVTQLLQLGICYHDHQASRDARVDLHHRISAVVPIIYGALTKELDQPDRPIRLAAFCQPRFAP